MKLIPELQEISKRVRVLRDRVLVKPLPYVHPILETPGVQIHKGVVVAIGYGRRTRRKVRFNQKMDTGADTGRSLYFEDGPETGTILPMRVKVGDVVEFSFRNGFIIRQEDLRQAGLPYTAGDMLMIWQGAIMTVDPEESLSDAMMFANSAGYDRNGNFLSGAEHWQR